MQEDGSQMNLRTIDTILDLDVMRVCKFAIEFECYSGTLEFCLRAYFSVQLTTNCAVVI